MTRRVIRDEDPERIPESWPACGCREDASGPEREAYAIRAAPVVVEHTHDYYVPGNRTHPGRDHAEERLEVLYVARDGEHAHVQLVDATRHGETLRPSSQWYATLALDAGAFDRVDEPRNRDQFREDLVALYGDIVEPLDWPEATEEFRTAREVRADGGGGR